MKYLRFKTKQISTIVTMVLMLALVAPSIVLATGVDGTVQDPGNIAVGGLSAGQESTQTALKTESKIAEAVLVPLMSMVMNQLLNKVNNSIVNWVNSGFEGNPFYIDDPKQFFTNLAMSSASDVAGSVRTSLNNLEKCEDPTSTVSSEQCNNFQSKTSERAILYALGNKAFSGVTDALATNPDTLKAFGQSLGNSANPVNTFNQIQGSLQGFQNNLASLSGAASQLSQVSQNMTSGNIAASDFNTVNSIKQSAQSTLSGMNQSVSSVQSTIQNIATLTPNAQGIQNVSTNLQAFGSQVAQAVSNLASIQVPNPPANSSASDLAALSGSLSSSIQSLLGEMNSITQSGNSIVATLGALGNGSLGTGAQGALEMFQKDFKQGGLLGYEAILMDDNATPIGKYMNTLATIGKSVVSDTEAIDNAGAPLSETKCAPGKERTIRDAEGEPLSTYCLGFSVETPGNVIQEQLNKSLASKNEAVVASGNSPNPYATAAGQIASAALSSLTTSLMTSGFNSLTDVASNLVFNDEPTPSEGFVNVTDVGNPFGFADQQDQNNGGAAFSKNFSVEKYLAGYPVLVQVDYSDVILRSDNTLARKQDVFNSFATLEKVTSPFTLNGATLDPTNLSEEEFEVVRITEDLQNKLPKDYYLIEKSNNFLSPALYELGYDTTTLAIAPTRSNGAIQRMDEMASLYRRQLATLVEIPSLALEMDKKCVLGPDTGWYQRLQEVSARESQKAQRKDAKKKDADNEWGRALDGLDTAFGLAIEMTQTGIQVEDPFSREYSIYLRELTTWDDVRLEVQKLLPTVSVAASQLAELESEYFNQNANSFYTIDQIEARIKKISERDQATLDNIQNQEIVLDRLEKAIERYQEKLVECEDRKAKVFEPNMTYQQYSQIVPSINTNLKFTELRNRILQDNIQALYCPWKEVNGPFRILSATSNSIPDLEELILEAEALLPTSGNAGTDFLTAVDFLESTQEDYGFTTTLSNSQQGLYTSIEMLIEDIEDRITELNDEANQSPPLPAIISSSTQIPSYRVRYPEGASGISSVENRKIIDIKCSSYYEATEVDYITQINI